jgi:cAMP-dependent protein kinase regulator/CRP/FNR family cyclic AMP-dependent transcriptional regulator/cGMP-dependent protein kinase 2
MSFFATFDPSDLAQIADRATEVDADEGEALTTEGDFGYALYAIENGTAEVSSDGRVIRTLGPGDVFGEIAVLASGRRTATVTATSPMELLALFKRDVWALERDCPGVAERLRALIAERQAATAQSSQ